ncbi:MAG: hypothetical protein KAG18_00875, partial [Sinobacterium sp.]|nr:hypothetical protein [Sinobacterium sp.]
NVFTTMPAKRAKGMEKNTAIAQALGLTANTKAAFIDDFEIDFLRYKVPPNEKDCLIPQQLLMMQTADHAARDAGLKESSNVAVLVAMGIELELHQYRGRVNLSTQVEDTLLAQGINLSDSERLNLTNIAKDSIASAAQLNQYTSFIGNIMASRISALWDFSGPAFTLSAEENSVNRAIELADSLFQTSDVEAVIIAAVDLSGSIENISLRQNTAPNLTPLAESATANVLAQQGFIPADMAGSFVIKPQSKVDNADDIYATIDSLNFTADYSSRGLLATANESIQQAGLNTADIDSVEAHASGFSKEMDIEAKALQPFTQTAVIDSAKRLFGHGFAASGMAAIIHSALKLNKQEHRHTLITGLGRDETAAALVMSASASTRTLNKPAAILNPAGKVRPQLLKRVSLGGKAISELLHAGLNSADFSASKKTLAAQVSTATANTQSPLDFSNISMPFISEAIVHQAADITTTNLQTLPGDTAVQKTPKPQLSAVTAAPRTTAQNTTVFSSQGSNIPASLSLSDQVLRTHKAFLESRKAAQDHMSQLIQVQANAEQGFVVNLPTAANSTVQSNAVVTPVAAAVAQAFSSPTDELKAADKMSKGIVLTERFSKPSNIIFTTEDLVEFAEGDIAKVFGDEYAIIDTYPRRVRLPTTDYLLVTRVTDLDATINEFKPCTMATEYDIPMDAPFLIDGQIPWSVSVESGQCDLMLISYLGIDFECKSERVYRLLDCELTFLEDMPFGGETLRYEIKIDSFARNGDQVLFFFHYDCFVNGKKVLIMRNGCAGFFTDEELADGKGVIHNDKDKAEFADAVKTNFTPLINNSRTEYNYQDMMCLVNGNIAACLGSEYDQQGRNPSLKFSSKKFLMIERITKIDRTGGHWGL